MTTGFTVADLNLQADERRTERARTALSGYTLLTSVEYKLPAVIPYISFSQQRKVAMSTQRLVDDFHLYDRNFRFPGM
jgi:hypothetical protein